MDAPSHSAGLQVPASPSTVDVLTSSEIRTFAERLLTSRCLSNAPGQRHFLRFVVEETLAGRGQDLKEYVIGVQVLGRQETFDPRTDASVRVAAGRLRQRLDEYYAAEGREDEVVISLERGGYRPDFQRRAPERPAAPAPQADAPPSKRHGKALVIAGTLLTVVVTAALVFWLWGRRDPLATPGGVIAVLPFANATADPATEYVCFGVVEDLTTALTGIEGVRVIARTSASQFAAKGLDLVDVGRKLGAGLLIEGSVRRDGARLIVSAQLIEARTGTHLWAQSYEREAAEGVAAQQHVATSIADAVTQRIGRRFVRAVSASRPASPEGLDLYWKGRFVRAQRTPESLQQAIVFFEQAVTRDPSHAESHAALGDALAADGFRQTVPPADTVQRARRELQQALALDPDCAPALYALAWLQFFYDHDWPAASAGFKRALDINPSSAQAHNLYALALAAHGRADEAIEHSRQALRLDPVRYAASNDNGAVLWCARRYDDAVAASQRVLDADPTYGAARVLRGIAHMGRRDYPQARADLEASRQSLGPVSLILGRLGQVYALSGDTTRARTIAAEMERLVPKGEVAYVHLAFVYAALGDHTRALDCLDRADALHEADVNFIGVDLSFDSLRREPRFVALLERLGLNSP